MMGIPERVAQVKKRVEDEAKNAGRAPEHITILAVVKGRTPEQIRAVVREGISHIGENRTDEGLYHQEALREETVPITWHFIGHLQSNKVRDVVGRYSIIHSVDSLKLAAKISRRAEEMGIVQRILIEVNIGEEATKYGFPPKREVLRDILKQMCTLPSLRIEGLMTIPPHTERVEERRAFFSRLRTLRDEVSNDTGLSLPHLSMGMSEDYPLAISEGATIIRIGRAFFE